MFNFIEKLKEIIRKMVAYDSVEETIEATVYSSEKMEEAIELWKSIYTNQSPWISTTISSLGLGKEIAQSMQMMVLSEMETKIDNSDFLDKQYQNNLVEKLPDQLEKAMALGGMIARPYVVGDDIFVDFCCQGDFLPIAFDDNGDIFDVAFIKRIVSGAKYFARIERQTFHKKERTIAIKTKAFLSKRADDVGTEIPLTSVSDWAEITPEIVIENADRPLFGYYKVPIANNVDTDSPMGISIFSPATGLIQKADEQFSRLDWEYEGGQMAVEVSEDAIPPEGIGMDEIGERIYRRLDFDSNDTYHVFNPSLRDANYMAGLDKYLMRIEDLVGLARGTISEVVADARTATEIKILKQKTYITVKSHQKAIDKMLEGCVYAMSVLATLYLKQPSITPEVVTDWKDSILTDTSTELDERLKCIEAGIDSKEETRAWRKGEDIETAREKIAEITASQGSGIEDAFKGLM